MIMPGTSGLVPGIFFAPPVAWLIMDVVREALNFYKPCRPPARLRAHRLERADPLIQSAHIGWSHADPLHGFAHIGWAVQTP